MLYSRKHFNEPEIIVEASEARWVKCPSCGKRFAAYNRSSWNGYRHITCGQKLKIINFEQEEIPITESVWCMVGNIIDERPYGPGGLEKRSGTKHFAPGAKVYCFPQHWGDGYEKIEVLGRHRISHRYVRMVISTSWLKNCRIELVYSPFLIKHLMDDWDGSETSKKLAEELAKIVNERNSISEEKKEME